MRTHRDVAGAVLVLLLVQGCGASLLDAAVYAANGARSAEVVAGELIRERCTDEYRKARSQDRVLELDHRCVPARTSYGTLRTARLGLLAAIAVYKARGNDDDLRRELERVAERVLAASHSAGLLPDRSP